MWKKLNRFESQQHKRAIAKKERAKSKHFGIIDSPTFSDVDDSLTRSSNASTGIISWVELNTISILDLEEWTSRTWIITRSTNQVTNLVIWDKVLYSLQNNAFMIERIFQRKGFISRIRWDSTRISQANEKEHILAANIDIAVIVAPIKEPDFHPNLVDRYLIMCQYWWVSPIICLNKVDLTDYRDPSISWYKDNWIEVIEVSTHENIGLDKLQWLLRWKTSVLVGKSGVGKTSIINFLTKNAIGLRTQEVNKKSWEWKHTTTASELYDLWEMTYIIDTPWIRALGVTNIPRSDLKNYFPEFTEHSKYCRYSDCTHSHEPDCGVKDALEEWAIAKSRYESYIRILQDLV